MTGYFTSDLHIGHQLVAQHRGFGNDTDGHDGWLAQGWDTTVTEDDDVWLLGDLTLHRSSEALEWIKNRPGRKHLISGNHDECHPMHRGWHRKIPHWLKAFESVQPFGTIRIEGQKVLLSHFPYSDDRGEPRYMEWRMKDSGMWLLHGHTHKADQKLHGREIHVGIDAWKQPVPIGAIGAIIRQESK